MIYIVCVIAQHAVIVQEPTCVALTFGSARSFAQESRTSDGRVGVAGPWVPYQMIPNPHTARLWPEGGMARDLGTLDPVTVIAA